MVYEMIKMATSFLYACKEIVISQLNLVKNKCINSKSVFLPIETIDQEKNMKL